MLSFDLKREMDLTRYHLHQVLVSHLVGGAAVVALRLAGAARERSQAITAWIPGEGPASERLDALGVNRRKYDLEALKSHASSRLLECGRMTIAFARSRPSVVHVHNPVVFALMRPALRLAGVRAVVHFHIEPTPEEIAWVLTPPPAQIIACAKYLARQISEEAERLGVPVPIAAVPNAVDLERFVPGDRFAARQRLGLPVDRFAVLMVANLARHKGQTTALQATKALVDRGIPVELWLLGEDRQPGSPFERELKQLTSELGLTDRVRCLGFQRDIPAYLQAADAFLLPSTHEGLPLSVLEAQACGVPVIGSTIPGISEVVADGVTGFTVASDNPAGYAERLWELFHNRALAASMTTAAARQVLQTYSFAALEARVFELYAQTSPR